MAETKGFVVNINENGWAQVISERLDACAHCPAKNNCHSSCSSVKIETKALNKIGADIGNHVSISLSSGRAIKSAAALYLIPVSGLMAGAIFGGVIDTVLAINETLSSILFGSIGLILGFVLTLYISRKMSSNNQLTPVITRILKPQAFHPFR
ncbi:MAG: SoxR reducing system RseC family protein [Deltaproteobacteria bacterium]|nr:SoxR reducing system RseC family protein [Deltaproteobacteria bacterium]MBW1994614.1 SoxR reducing system RseC family protein [Deltaproteobacteria bacterium]MBW2150210.1 SoxR reducing system RseC family protein [Deltaproteobacteria bacterium]